MCQVKKLFFECSFSHPWVCINLVNWLKAVCLLLSYSLCQNPVKGCLCSCRWAVNQTHCSIKAKPRIWLLFSIRCMYVFDPERMNHTLLQKRLPLKLILHSQNVHHSIPWQKYNLTQTSNICCRHGGVRACKFHTWTHRGHACACVLSAYVNAGSSKTKSKNASCLIATVSLFPHWLQCSGDKKSHWYNLWPWQVLKGLILPGSVLSNAKSDFNCQLLIGGGGGGQ